MNAYDVLKVFKNNIHFIELSYLIFRGTNICFYLEYVYEIAQTPKQVYVKSTFQFSSFSVSK